MSATSSKMPKLRMPPLPLRPDHHLVGYTLDSKGVCLTPAAVAWLNRAAKSYRYERPKLRRALLDAIDNLLGYMGGPRDMDENELGLLLRLHSALGKKERAKFEREWNKRSGR